MNTKKAEARSSATESSQAAGAVEPAGAVDTEIVQEVYAALEQLALDTVNGLVVAYSGGVDSHVLLKCVVDWCHIRHADVGIAPSLRAHHIDHGLQADSRAWAGHCSSICAQLNVDLTTSHVAVDLQSGYSPEDAARRARYDALRADLQSDEVLLVAHHADDQAETLLLQLFRGAGVHGLAAMPIKAPFGNGQLLRPLLQVASDRIREFANCQQLSWIDDPSNSNDRFDRNLLRNQVLPILRARWPSIARSISRSAAHCAEAVAINRLFAHRVLAEHIDSRQLPIQKFAVNSIIENKTLLRCWIEHHGFLMPSAAKLNLLLTDLIGGGNDSAGELLWGGACIRRYRDCLYLGTSVEFDDCNPFFYEWPLQQPVLTIAETGQVLRREDIPAAYANQSDGLIVRSRQGGEQIQLAGHLIHKSVKKLFQECATPPWLRGKMPFIYCGDTLVGIVGIGFAD